MAFKALRAICRPQRRGGDTPRPSIQATFLLFVLASIGLGFWSLELAFDPISAPLVEGLQPGGVDVAVDGNAAVGYDDGAVNISTVVAGKEQGGFGNRSSTHRAR